MDKTIVWVFDMDNTLVFSDDEATEKSFYRELHFKSYDKHIATLFKTLRHNGHIVKILTGRHPELQKKIADIFKIKELDVLCRGINLTRNEEQTFYESEEMRTKFLDELTDWKIGILNGISSWSPIVIYFDDGFEYYVNREDLADNVICLPPTKMMLKRLNLE